MASALEELRKFNREHFHWIWKVAQAGVAQAGDLEALSEEDMRLGEIMLEHEEYHNQFEIADHLSNHEFDAETETNPFLHIVFHQIVENQLEARDPIEAYQFFNAMLKRKISRHDVIHLIGSILSGFILICLEEQREFDLERYKFLLKKYRNRNPDKLQSLLENNFDWQG
jgi:hypothetical protein